MVAVTTSTGPPRPWPSHLIKPTSIDTPYPQHARNYMAEEPKLPPPVYPPEEVARAILHAATHPVRELYVGGSARMMSTVSRMAPAVSERLSRPMMMNQQRRDEPAGEPPGALHEPGVGGRVRGDLPGYVMRRSLYTRSAMHAAVSGAVLASAGVAAAAWMSSRRRQTATVTTHRKEWD